MENERLEFLLNRYFDQALSAGEKSELERMLLESEAARGFFWELARWHGSLRQWGQEEWGRRDAVEAQAPIRALPSPPQRKMPPPPRRKIVQRSHSSSSAWWPLAAAAVVVIGFFAWMNRQSSNSAQSTGAEIAVLTHASSAVWLDENSPHANGEVLHAGWLKLKSGALQVEFSRGARVVIEGPAEFELLSDNSGALRHGKLVATVPKSAHGFSVRAANFSVVDYGTQFGCVVPLAGAAEVHVFKGMIGLKTAASAKTELHEQQAVRLAESELQEIPVNPNAFLTEEKLARLDNDNARVRPDAWRKASAAFSQHPGMLVHFDFEKSGEDRTLINRAPNAPAGTDGSIVGCDWTERRWPGKSALEFKGNNDRVRLSLPGEYTTLTFLARVRADHIPFRENTLLRAEYQEQLGEVGWYIFRDGALGWSVRAAPRGARDQWLHAHTPPIFRGDSLGSWRLIATVFDGMNVTHYLDGKVVASVPMKLPAPLRLGRFDVGNYSFDSAQESIPQSQNVREMVGNFFGRIDELAILSVPLSAEEIQSYYEQGRPN